MEYHDKVLKCAECGAEFVFTGGEQMFFADKGFKNEPKRCKACKAKRAEGGETTHDPVSGQPKPITEQQYRDTGWNVSKDHSLLGQFVSPPIGNIPVTGTVRPAKKD